MFILTFANLVHVMVPIPDSITNKLHFSKLLGEHHLNILEII